MLKHEHILITAGNAFRATALRPKFGTWMTKACRLVQKVKPLSTICVDPLSTN